MKIRFQADNDLDQRIVVATMLQRTADAGRVLVSHDRRTLPRFFGKFTKTNTSPGLIVVSQRLPVGRAAELLHLLWVASEAEEYINIIYDLP